MNGQFSAQDFTANTKVSIHLSSGESIEGNITDLKENFLEILISTVEVARKIQVAYSHIVYIEQIKVPTQVSP